MINNISKHLKKYKNNKIIHKSNIYKLLLFLHTRTFPVIHTYIHSNQNLYPQMYLKIFLKHMYGMHVLSKNGFSFCQGNYQ